MADDYQHGSMDITENNATYAGFMAMFKWGSLLTAVGVLFFATLFCTTLGFLPAAAFAGVLLIGGTVFLLQKPSH